MGGIGHNVVQMSYEVCVWAGRASNVDDASLLRSCVTASRWFLPPTEDLDQFMAWLVDRDQTLASRPWRIGWVQPSGARGDAVPDLYGGYLVLNLSWTTAAKIANEFVLKALELGLSVFLPFGPPAYGQVCLAPGDQALSADYWTSLDEWERTFDAASFPDSRSWGLGT